MQMNELCQVLTLASPTVDIHWMLTLGLFQDYVFVSQLCKNKHTLCRQLRRRSRCKNVCLVIMSRY